MEDLKNMYDNIIITNYNKLFTLKFISLFLKYEQKSGNCVF